MTSPSPFARPDGDDPAGPTPPRAAPVPRSEQAELDAMAAEFGPRQRRQPPRGLWLVGAAALVALAVVALVVARDIGNQKSTSDGPGERAVAFLNAVAHGDADAARAMAWEKVEGPLLTRAALDRSRQRAAISDVRVVRVGEATETGTDVVLGYQRGDQKVQGTFQMVLDTDGTWRVRRPSARVRIAPTPKMMVVQLDGEKLRSNGYTYDVELFPGLHPLSTGSRWLRFEEPDVAVDGVTGVPQPKARAVLAPETEQRIKDVVTQRSDTCLGSGELAPQGCPWALKPGPNQSVRPGSVSYTLLQRRIDLGRLGEADAILDGRAPMKVRLKATAHIAGSPGQINQDIDVPGQFKVDLLTDGPDFIWTN